RQAAHQPTLPGPRLRAPRQARGATDGLRHGSGARLPGGGLVDRGRCLYVPEEVKRHPIPPRPPKPVRRTPRSDKAAKAQARAKAQTTSQQAQEPLDTPPADKTLGAGIQDAGEAIATVRALLDAAQALQAARDLSPSEHAPLPGDAPGS